MALADFPGQILKESRKMLKESGVNTLCLAEGFVIREDGEASVRSPILLTPIEYRIDRVRNVIHFEQAEEAQFINPYIEFLLQSHEVAFEGKVDTIAQELSNAGFTVDLESLPCIGNFHHHRYAVLRELENLLEQQEFSSPLETLLDTSNQLNSNVALPPDLLLPADLNHLAVFDQVSKGNTVIQGPPGTGKSQVLTNILGKLLATKKSSVVLSEKRVALEVLLQKLEGFGLNRLGFIVTNDAASKDLLKQLEENWNYFEQSTFPNEPNLRLSEQYTSQLQFSLDLLNQPDAIGGIPLYDFREWMSSIEEHNNIFLDNPPSVPDLQKHADLLKKVYAKNLADSIAAIDPKTVQRDNFNEVASEIGHWRKILSSLNAVIPFSTWADLRYITKQAVLCQNLENHQQKQYADLYKSNSRKQKRFFKLYSNWNRLQKELSARALQFEWKQTPNKLELLELQAFSKRTSFYARRKFARLWKKYSAVAANVSQNAIDELVNFHDLEVKKSQLIVDFCDLGILEPEKEVDLLHHSIQSFVQSEWEIIQDLTPKQVSYLTESHQVLGTSASVLGSLLLLEDDTPLIARLIALEKDFGEINAMQAALKNLTLPLIQLLGVATSYADCEAIVANSHWSIFRQRFPSFSTFKLEDLHEKTQAIIDAQAIESHQFSIEILTEVQQQFRQFQTLLNTPARQLSEEDKALKKRLRKGKSILVKEFAKTRSHPSVRELFASEAREWIQLLIPIWLSNPTQISKTFPLHQNLFDVAIFDEASQIPLQNSLGALQRSTHGIIAGDSQQMGPTSYFKSGSSEIVDVLHQASFHWQNGALKHHYRSLHPELIAFSNKHFYQGELTAYPAFGIENPIRHHLISEGIFEDRKNAIEAKAIAQEIEVQLKQKQTLGIVAFSEEQLLCIRKQLSASSEKLLAERLEEGTAFFKSLENVQGDECDHLLISFGYGKDPEGNFAMRFGPLNTENGRRRLNVLLTRARNRMDFYSSVSYSDFKLSDNESIDLLRLWFANLEATTQSSDSLALPIDADFSTQESVLTLRKPHVHFTKAEEFVTFQSVMEARGWKLHYQ
ncbi:MAG: hypothetical protein Crog4KO_29500 [Crocinitomicaceae bacterium]